MCALDIDIDEDIDIRKEHQVIETGGYDEEMDVHVVQGATTAEWKAAGGRRGTKFMTMSYKNGFRRVPISCEPTTLELFRGAGR